MTGIVYRFDDSVIRHHLERLLLLQFSTFESVLSEIGEYMVGEIQDNLDEQKLWDGKDMPQSKAAEKRKGGYVKSKSGEEHYSSEAEGGGKTLIDKKHLYESYIYQLAEGSSIEIGSDKVYASIHHFGGETGRKGHRFTLPARPVMGLGIRREEAIGAFLLDELKRAQM